MHLYHKVAQSDECLICFEKLNKKVSMTHLINDEKICLECMEKFAIIEHTLFFHHYPMRILYDYNPFFQSLLYQYKGLYDYALKDAFLALFKDELKRKYKDYIIVVVPSSDKENSIRGFSPMKEIASTLHDHIFMGLYKKVDYKQSLISFKERKSVKDKIGINHGERLKGKKVLILDDVITSGSTMEACADLVEDCHPECIEILVLASSHW